MKKKRIKKNIPNHQIPFLNVVMMLSLYYLILKPTTPPVKMQQENSKNSKNTNTENTKNTKNTNFTQKNFQEEKEKENFTNSNSNSNFERIKITKKIKEENKYSGGNSLNTNSNFITKCVLITNSYGN